jgi:long-chain acyl-CoA synthetase
MMMPNILQYPVAIFAALTAGLVVVNINPLYTAPELAYQLNDAGAEAIIVLENFADRLEIALPKTKVKHVIITKIGDLLGFFKGTVYNLVSRYIQKKIPKYHLPNALFFKACLLHGKKLTFQPVDIDKSDLAFLQYTGGTTGGTKGAMLTHRNIVANVLQCAVWIRATNKENRDVMLGALPLYHIFSLTVCGICIFAMGASSLLIANPRDIPSLINAMKKTKVTIAIGLNTLFNGLLNNPNFQKLNFSSLKLTMSGGMALQKVVAERWQKITGVPILEGYGLTETSPVVTLCPINKMHYTGSIGVPISSTDVVIRNELGQDLPLKEVGEICVHGPQVMKGYWYRAEETRNVLDDNGWLRTGDIGYMDAHGYVYIVDRKKDMVLVSGFNVYPNEIEGVIATHPGVQTVAVIGIPSEKTGEALKAFVIRKDPNLTEEQLIAYCRQSLTGYKIPHIIAFRDQLPMSAVGKVLRRELREEEIKVIQNRERRAVC